MGFSHCGSGAVRPLRLSTAEMPGTSVVLVVTLKLFSVQASLGHLPQLSCKAFMLLHLWEEAERS